MFGFGCCVGCLRRLSTTENTRRKVRNSNGSDFIFDLAAEEKGGMWWCFVSKGPQRYSQRFEAVESIVNDAAIL